ncbi:MAG: sigma 54-interacting transcriptional regulator, partial [Myxococcota bacterium]
PRLRIGYVGALEDAVMSVWDNDDEDVEIDSQPGDPRARPLPSPSPREVTNVGGALRLIVIEGDTYHAYPVSEEGEIIVGRSAQCDVCILGDAVSRRHCRFDLGTQITVTDLKSANGTHRGEDRLPPDEPQRVEPGDVLRIGGITLMFQAGVASERPRKLCTHSYFEIRLEDQCRRGIRDGNDFTVVRLRADPSLDSETLTDALGEALGGTDIVGSYGPNEYETLIVSAGADDVPDLLDRMISILGHEGDALALGIAVFPRHGRSAAALLARACDDLDESEPEFGGGDALVLHDSAMRNVYHTVDRVAEASIPVLLRGESGVGKEVVARELHKRSPRHEDPFLAFNCAAVSESLLESELFGYDRGAFTGALEAKKGLIEAAHGGTVYLDEVSELPMSAQLKLIRVLEERRIRRTGSVKSIPVDVRFVTATSRDLQAATTTGTFSRELLSLLDGASVTVPPLRDRTAEIVPFAEHFLARAARRRGIEKRLRLTKEVRSVLERYQWPGNIREMRNTMERAVLLCTGDKIQLEHLPIEKMVWTKGVESDDPWAMSMPKTFEGDATTIVSALHRVTPEKLEERRRIMAALDETDGDLRRTATILGMPRAKLVEKIAELRISSEKSPSKK